MLNHNPDYDAPKQALLSLCLSRGTGVAIPYGVISEAIGYDYPSREWWSVVNWCRKELKRTHHWHSRCHDGAALEFLVAFAASEHSVDFRTPRLLGQTRRMLSEQASAMATISLETDMRKRQLIQSRADLADQAYRAARSTRHLLRKSDTLPTAEKQQ